MVSVFYCLKMVLVFFIFVVYLCGVVCLCVVLFDMVNL